MQDRTQASALLQAQTADRTTSERHCMCQSAGSGAEILHSDKWSPLFSGATTGLPGSHLSDAGGGAVSNIAVVLIARVVAWVGEGVGVAHQAVQRVVAVLGGTHHP